VITPKELSQLAEAAEVSFGFRSRNTDNLKAYYEVVKILRETKRYSWKKVADWIAKNNGPKFGYSTWASMYKRVNLVRPENPPVAEPVVEKMPAPHEEAPVSQKTQRKKPSAIQRDPVTGTLSMGAQEEPVNIKRPGRPAVPSLPGVQQPT
jgi:hypothetical protein